MKKLSASELTEMWRRFKQGGCQDARAALIEQYVYLVAITAGKHVRVRPDADELGDRMGEGYLGLIKAVDIFDIRRGVKFETLAITLIKGSILEGIRQADWVPRKIRENDKAVEAAETLLSLKHPGPPSEEEIAAEMGWSEARLAAHRSFRAQESLTSLEMLYVFKGDAKPLSELLATCDPSVEMQVMKTLQREHLRKTVDRLPEREKLVIALYYHEGMTLAAIATVLEVSESRAYQLRDQALVRLRSYLEGAVCSE